MWSIIQIGEPNVSIVGLYIYIYNCCVGRTVANKKNASYVFRPPSSCVCLPRPCRYSGQSKCSSKATAGPGYLPPAGFNSSRIQCTCARVRLSPQNFVRLQKKKKKLHPGPPKDRKGGEVARYNDSTEYLFSPARVRAGLRSDGENTK